MKILLYTSILIIFLSQSACGPLKYKKVSAKDYPPDPKERIQKNMEEGRGFRIMDVTKKGGGNYDFANSNPLWRATLDTLDFMPLVSANYSGGIVITDWYADNSTSNESIKITVRFLTNEIRSDALDIKVFTKECDLQNKCVISEKSQNLVTELKREILKKAAVYEKDIKEKNKRPYELSGKMAQ